MLQVCLSYKGQTLPIVCPDSQWGGGGGLVVFQPVNNARDAAIVIEGQQTVWPRPEDIYQQKQWGY